MAPRRQKFFFFQRCGCATTTPDRQTHRLVWHWHRRISQPLHPEWHWHRPPFFSHRSSSRASRGRAVMDAGRERACTRGRGGSRWSPRDGASRAAGARRRRARARARAFAIVVPSLVTTPLRDPCACMRLTGALDRPPPAFLFRSVRAPRRDGGSCAEGAGARRPTRGAGRAGAAGRFDYSGASLESRRSFLVALSAWRGVGAVREFCSLLDLRILFSRIGLLAGALVHCMVSPWCKLNRAGHCRNQKCVLHS